MSTDSLFRRRRMADGDVDTGEPVRRRTAGKRQVMEGDLELRVSFAKAREQLWVAHGRWGTDEPHGDRPAAGPSERLGSSGGVDLGRQRPARVRQERLAGAGQRDAAGVSLEQLD